MHRKTGADGGRQDPGRPRPHRSHLRLRSRRRGPDIYVLGKALGEGSYPVSAVATDEEVLGVVTPGSHGSIFGGNRLAATVGLEVVDLLRTGEYQERARRIGARLTERLGALIGHGLFSARVHGAWAGVDVDPELMTAR